MKYPQSYFESSELVRLSYSRIRYNEMKKMGKEKWWAKNGKGSSYANFLGTKNFNELMSDFKYFGSLEK